MQLFHTFNEILKPVKIFLLSFAAATEVQLLLLLFHLDFNKLYGLCLLRYFCLGTATYYLKTLSGAPTLLLPINAADSTSSTKTNSIIASTSKESFYSNL